MELRQLGRSDFHVPILSFGTGSFGGAGPLFGAWGNHDANEARRLVDICLDSGISMFDTADAYSKGASEEVLGEAIRGRRDKVIVATKIGLPTSDEPGDWGLSRARLLLAVERSLCRLGTDFIDLLQFHGLDAFTPADEIAATIETLVSSGKVRHVGVSNYPGWQLMKAMSVAERSGSPRPVAHQVYYSLIGRDYEADLMPLAKDQDLGALVWSPLGWGRLTGKIRRGVPLPKSSRLHATADFGPPVDDEYLFRVIDALEAVAEEAGRTVPQVALNWLIQRPTVASVIIGARNEQQLLENLGSVGWTLTNAQMQVLNDASAIVPLYPHFLYRSGGFAKLNPPMV